ncbi:hypothetical protein [Pseudomonas piscis]|uniref:hypothetical protein n=1 Tax=Pseudomonas piscis TaxID=2614538 RepID=UPI0003B572E3|nr:hypothetical protein P308_16485 [Pseudomonas piscis]
MSWSFRRLCSLTALICLLLALAWGLVPGLLLTLWGLDYNPVAGFVARRNALLFLALAVIFHQFRDVGHSPARQALGNGMAIGCFALAGLGTWNGSMAMPGRASSWRWVRNCRWAWGSSRPAGFLERAR